ncbi:ABC transporter ATP-binding protein [Agreia sp. PsM10]|uniref:ABC transporter ATP-binding protein n=1 Tax=Agreia sp. PsM10 TaxID=3030533 RepID=UPI00263AC2C3|nr:ABC transporter ATP-binding protein [Agreia sp. PsM10]MDN4639295.1 ABC transporter ATP-binding protein [Agreia sp. PsM10]
MTSATPVVRVENVSKRFIIRKEKSLKERLVNAGRSSKFKEDFWALQDVSLEVNAGSTIGLIGPNGSGKSTLLKAIGGIIEPTSGSVFRRGRLAALLELGAGFHPDLTGRENVYLNASILGLSRRQTDYYFDDIVDFSGIHNFIDTQVKFYSSGMYVRLAFAVAIHVDPDLLLVDEVLAVGDEAFQRKCLDKIRAFQTEGRTIVLVTHSLEQVNELCDRAVLLSSGRMIFDGIPHEATQMMRNVLEDRRLDEVQEKEKEDEPVAVGSISDVSVWAEGRRLGEPVQPGDSLVVRATFAHSAGIRDWIAAVQVNSSLGHVVFGTNNERLGMNLGYLKDERTIEFVVPDVSFGSGKYFVNISLMDEAHVHVIDKAQAASFDVPYFEAATGVVFARPSMKQLT